MIAYASAGIILDGGSGGGWDGGASSYSSGWDSGAGGYSGGGWDSGSGGYSGAEEEVQVVKVIQESGHGHDHHAHHEAPLKIVKVGHSRISYIKASPNCDRCS